MKRTLRHNSPLALLAIACGAALVVSGCTRVREYLHPPDVARAAIERGGSAGGSAQSAVITRKPWDVWPLGADLSGAPLRDAQLLRGDELTRSGNYKGALEEYSKINAQNLSSSERDALALRIASTNLTLNNADQSLISLSRYFNSRGEGVDQVDARFSLLFGFAYGRRGDVDQSLAWFTRVSDVSAGPQAALFAGSANQGMRLVFRSSSAAELDRVVREWGNNESVRQLVGEESQRRSLGSGDPSPEEISKIWGGEALVPAAGAKLQIPTNSPLGVVLPLTGRFASLGASMKNGIELASEGQGQPGSPLVQFIDSGDDAATAVARTRELLANQSIRMVLGPLISEHAASVSEVARERQVALLTFSKSSRFPTGGLIFRLAPTVDSQVDSLLDAAVKKLRVSKFALVYPEDPSGNEYAQSFREGLHAVGGALLYETSFARGDPNALLAAAQEIEQRGVEAVFFPDTVISASRFLSSFAQASRDKIKFLGPVVWDDEARLQRSQSAMNGAIFVSPYFARSERASVAQFNDSYKSRYTKKADFLAAQGFDAATIALAALQAAAGSQQTPADALRSVGTYEGLTGTITVESSGEVKRKLAVIQFIDGQLRELGVAESEPSPSFTYRGNQAVPEQPGAKAPAAGGDGGSAGSKGAVAGDGEAVIALPKRDTQPLDDILKEARGSDDKKEAH